MKKTKNINYNNKKEYKNDSDDSSAKKTTAPQLNNILQLIERC